MAGLHLFTDLPLKETKQDGLGFVSYAEALTAAIRDTPGPFTIGIFGEWGTGKTSLMQLVKNSFTNEDKIFPIWFNAWQYEQEEHPLVPLVATIVTQLQQNKTFVQSLGPGKSASLLETLRTLASHQSLKVKFKLHVAEVEWAPDLQALRKTPPKKGFWSRLFRSAPTGAQLTRLLDHSIYYHALDTLADIKIGADIKVVVFIDDLDRCFPDKAIKLLESIKLILSQAGFIFVLGVSGSVIEGHLKHRYVKRFGLEEFHGQKYLEKIVQLPFPISPVREPLRIKNFFEKLFAGQPRDTGPLQDFFDESMKSEDLLVAIASLKDYNPRGIIRFLNSLLTNMVIFDSQVQLGLIEETIPLGSFIVDRILREGWPPVYFVLSESESLCLLILDDKAGAIPPETLTEKDRTVIDEYNSNEVFRKLLDSPVGEKWLQQPKGRKSLQQFSRSLQVTLADLFLNIKSRRAPMYDVKFPGMSMYRWDATIQGQDDVLNAIESVTYRLHSSYPNPVRESIDRASGFKLKELAWGSSTLYADVKVRNQDEIITLSGTIKLNPDAPPTANGGIASKDL